MRTWSVCSTSRSSGDDEGAASGGNEDAVPVNLLIAKQRNGPTGDVELTFLKSYTRFERSQSERRRRAELSANMKLLSPLRGMCCFWPACPGLGPDVVP
jgi:hypothetical protein